MKRLKLIVFVLTAALMTSITYANPSDPSALQESFEALQKDFDEISQLALDLLKQKETEFHNKMESYREELDLKVDDLGSKFKKISRITCDVAGHRAGLLFACEQPQKSCDAVLSLDDGPTTTHGGRALSYDLAAMVYDVDHRRSSFEHFKR